MQASEAIKRKTAYYARVLRVCFAWHAQQQSQHCKRKRQSKYNIYIFFLYIYIYIRKQTFDRIFEHAGTVQAVIALQCGRESILT